MDTRGDFTVDVRHDTPVFVRIGFGSLDAPQQTEIVSTEEGLSEIASLYLGAGGGARTPVPPIPGTKTAPKNAAPAP